MRTHKVEKRFSTAVLKEATVDELVAYVNGEASKIKTLNATVDIATTVGGEKKGKVTDFQEIRGYVLVKKPTTLRMIGLFPVVRNRAFDMVSDGENFRLSIPTKNKFIIGSKDVRVPSKQPLENLRPQHILDALLLKEIDGENEIAVLELGTEAVKDTKSKKEVEQSTYVLDVIRKQAPGKWVLSRKIVFDRLELRPRKQILFDAFGNVATIASYDNFNTHEGVMFPDLIRIERPQEEYAISLGVVKMRLNDPMKDEQFLLPQPPGSVLQKLDEPKVAETPEPKGAKKHSTN